MLLDRHQVPVPRSARLLLAALTALFALRVGVQLLQYLVDDVSWLPGFDAWQSGAFPYSVLFTAQLVILALQINIVVGLGRGQRRPTEAVAPALFVAGLVYLGVMSFRLAASLTYATSGWLDNPFPSLFHVVLALFVVVWALTGYPAALADRSPHIVRHGAYPLIIAGACVMLYVMALSGVPLVLAAYIPVLLGVGLIIGIELRWPYRRAWQPTSLSAVYPDAVFLVVVQIGLPALLAGGYAFVAESLAESGWQQRALWPHSWPATLQVMAMVLFADLFRYPLHRAMHSKRPLWSLHAVHHSPERLYWLNVGRFHPLEKIAHGLFDALPFVILGVDEWVFAGYFVFYALNGFFQHSNADVELGPLNWIISGPELHRWHHSVEGEEARTNYGNNVIVWDVVFGTRVLPDGDVAVIGNGDPSYPTGFIPSISRPFRGDTT